MCATDNVSFFLLFQMVSQTVSCSLIWGWGGRRGQLEDSLSYFGNSTTVLQFLLEQHQLCHVFEVYRHLHRMILLTQKYSGPSDLVRYLVNSFVKTYGLCLVWVRVCVLYIYFCAFLIRFIPVFLVLLSVCVWQTRRPLNSCFLSCRITHCVYNHHIHRNKCLFFFILKQRDLFFFCFHYVLCNFLPMPYCLHTVNTGIRALFRLQQ